MTHRVTLIFLLLATAHTACAPRRQAPPAQTGTATDGRANAAQRPAACGGVQLSVHFFDVGQGLAALVRLPDGRSILVDAGDMPNRPGCGEPCQRAHEHFMTRLRNTLGGDSLSLVWLTHPHSDHVGGVAAVLNAHHVDRLIDNGRDLDVRLPREVHDAATRAGVLVESFGPGSSSTPILLGVDWRATGLAPSRWLPSCRSDRNACSIMLRIDYCKSSILFTGDAEIEEEELFDGLTPVTVLQVGHHGSETSTGDAFLRALSPKYAVISAGKPNEGTNRTYCHPRSSVVSRLTEALGGGEGLGLRALRPGAVCRGASKDDWWDVPASPHLWATQRDGDVTLVTNGDGLFTREPAGP